jgi:hypothetical protein
MLMETGALETQHHAAIEKIASTCHGWIENSAKIKLATIMPRDMLVTFSTPRF